MYLYGYPSRHRQSIFIKTNIFPRKITVNSSISPPHGVPQLGLRTSFFLYDIYQNYSIDMHILYRYAQNPKTSVDLSLLTKMFCKFLINRITLLINCMLTSDLTYYFWLVVFKFNSFF